MKMWLDLLTRAVNYISTEQTKIHNLLIYSISQNNVLGTFQASVIHKIELRLHCIEDKFMGDLGHQGPPNTSSSQKEKLDTIACKITNIEQKIITAPPKAGNPPGLQTKNLKTEGQGAKQKGTKATSEYWYHKDLKDFLTKRLILWACQSTFLWSFFKPLISNNSHLFHSIPLLLCSYEHTSRSNKTISSTAKEIRAIQLIVSTTPHHSHRNQSPPWCPCHAQHQQHHPLNWPPPPPELHDLQGSEGPPRQSPPQSGEHGR